MTGSAAEKFAEDNGFEFKPLGQGLQDFKPIIAAAEKAGFVPLVPGMSLKPGDRVYRDNCGKSAFFAVIGSICFAVRSLRRIVISVRSLQKCAFFT